MKGWVRVGKRVRVRGRARGKKRERVREREIQCSLSAYYIISTHFSRKKYYLIVALNQIFLQFDVLELSAPTASASAGSSAG